MSDPTYSQIRRIEIIKGKILKKTWVFLLLAYPTLRLLALPMYKDKRLQSAHAVRYYTYTHRSKCCGKCMIHPTWTFALPYLLRFKFTKFERRR